MKTSILRIPVLMATLLVIAHSAVAQTPYVWVDEHGVKQYSDQPPPPSVPKSKILKYSGKAVDNSDATSNGGDDEAKPAKAPASLADKELDYKKRHEEMAAKQKKADEDAKAAQTKAENCQRMRDYKASLDSGQRISLTDASGNRSYMTDEQRAQQQNMLSQNLGSCN